MREKEKKRPPRDTESELEQLRGDLREEIARRKKAEKLLVQTQDKLHATFEQSAQFIGLLELDGTLIEANTPSLEFYELQASDVLGKKFWECPWWSHSLELQQKLKTAVQEAAAGELVRFVVSHPAPDGMVHYVDFSLKPARNESGQIVYLIPEGRDITDHKLARDALRESEQKFATAFRSSPDSITLTNMADGRYVEVNQSFLQTTGFAAEEAIGKTSSELGLWVDPADRQRFIEVLRQNGSVRDLETRMKKKSGEIGYSSLSAEIINISDTPHLLTISRNISERKRAEEERLNLVKQIQRVRKMESLGIMAGGIAHDFNNLLMGVLGNVDLALQDVAKKPPLETKLEAIKTAAMRLAELTNQMLAFAGKSQFVKERMILSEVVYETGQLLESTISQNVDIIYDLAPDLPVIEADTSQIRQVIMNLITNASEACRDKGGTVRLTTGVLEADASYLKKNNLSMELQTGLHIYFDVADNGQGMDTSNLERIFDPFFTTKFTGRGLGLAAVQGIIKGHKGAITIRSKKNTGSTFRVLLPCPARLAETSYHEDPKKILWKGRGTILLVDDEPEILQVGKDMLELLGFEVLTAGDGQGALDLIKNQDQTIDLVILDLTMPHMDGLETFEKIRLVGEELPVLLSSGHSEQEATSKFVVQNLSGFLQKPYTVSALSAKLKDILS